VPTPYLDLSTFKSLTVMRPEDVDLVESLYPGFTVGQIAAEQDWLDSRLRKRYAVPFTAPAPTVVQRWLTAIVTMAVWDRRGAGDSQTGTLERAQKRFDEAKADVKEAADSDVGLFDLPTNDTPPASAVTRGGPLFYSESSPFVSADRQEREGRCEDEAGFGTVDGVGR
jgi:hypothetical protein